LFFYGEVSITARPMYILKMIAMQSNCNYIWSGTNYSIWPRLVLFLIENSFLGVLVVDSKGVLRGKCYSDDV